MSRRSFAKFSFLLVLAFSLILPTTLPQTARADTAADVATSAAPAVVQIIAYKNMPVYQLQYQTTDNGLSVTVVPAGMAERKVSSGSGFFINSNGYILTNKHVVPDTNADYVVVSDSSQFKGQVVYRDPNYDLAVVKVAGENFPTIKLSKGSAGVGQSVVAIGNALGRFLDTVSTGTVSSLSQDVVARDPGNSGGREELAGLIESDAVLYPGDSGGPLLNEMGQAIGVNVAIAVDQSYSYSIPASVARRVLERAGLNV